MADSISILDGLWKRQIGTCCYKNERISCKILRSVILLPRSKFTPVWSKESQKHICIGLDRRMYFDNHHYCYYNDGFGGRPALCYQLDDRVFGKDLSHKILAVLLYHCHIVQSPRLPEEKEVCLLVLTADGYLKILGANSGVILRSVFLSTAIRYKYLMWGSYLKTVQVKSTQSTNSPPLSGVGVVNSSCFLTIAVFKLHPLELLTCLPIQRKIFGEDIIDASVNDDLLVLTHRKGVVKMYSLPWIIEHCTMLEAPLGVFVELPREAGLGGIRAGTVGNPGFGIPWTVKLTECPPLLFEAKTSTQATGVSFGGHPTVYLHNSPKSSNQFILTSLQDKKPITVLETEGLAFHSDTAEFHSDDNRKVLQVSSCSLSCYRLIYDETKNKHVLHNQYSIDFRGDYLRDTTTPVRTASGRVVKRRYASLDINGLYTSAIQDVDYENETDLLYVVVTLPDSSSDANMQCNLHFIDERNGSVLKSVPLPTWEPNGDNSVYYELDCILHLRRNSFFSTCYYYRLE